MSEVRIGTRERELAMAALDAHRAEGRLEPGEYRERSAAAVAARTRADLDTLFADLPDPHPAYPAAAVPGSDAARDPLPDAARDPLPDAARDPLPELVAPAGSALGRNAGKLSALAPVIAFGLFALTGFRFPVIFLLVPVALAVLGYLGHREGG